MPGDRVLLAHGSGGTMMHRLLEELVFPAFRNPILEKAGDSAVFGAKGRLAFTADSFVVNPLFFPGGDIGKLAVCGTVNDLAVSGARPLYLTASCIIEEGFSMDDLRKIILSMRRAARETGVAVVGGDLKVVEKGSCDGIFINTSGIGTVTPGVSLGADRAMPTDAVLINGRIGDHAAAVMSARQNFGIATKIRSDCCGLNGLTRSILKASKRVRAMRDPTRGGVATTLNEIARASGVQIEIEEKQVPVSRQVRGFCELLGIEPLYMANEGKVLVIVPAADAKAVLDAMRRHPCGKGSRVIGKVLRKGTPGVLLKTAIGSTRVLDMLSGEQLPRIC